MQDFDITGTTHPKYDYYTQPNFIHFSFILQVRDVLPSSGPVDSLIEVGGYRFRTGDFASYYKYIYLGNQICDFWNNDTNSANVYGGRWLNGLYYIKCRIVEQIPGAWNASAVLTTWSGKTWNHSLAMKLDHNGQLSMFELYPGIRILRCNACILASFSILVEKCYTLILIYSDIHCMDARLDVEYIY